MLNAAELSTFLLVSIDVPAVLLYTCREISAGTILLAHHRAQLTWPLCEALLDVPAFRQGFPDAIIA